MKEIHDRLPFEVIYQILQDFVQDIRLASNDILVLILISKDWCEAVLISFFRTIPINDKQRATTILDNWNDGLFGSRTDSPVRTLTIRQLFYSEAGEREA